MKTFAFGAARRPPLRGCLVWAIGACLVGSIQAAGTNMTTVTFDLPPHPGSGSISVFNYYEQGMHFWTQSDYELKRVRSGGITTPDNGTDFIFYEHRNRPMVWNLINGFNFGLYSIDLAEDRRTVLPDGTSSLFPVTVNIHGFKLDGTTVSTSFTTDGVCDAWGPLADFQTFYFDERFAWDLTRVEIDTSAVLDNVVYFNVVPEPGPLVLLALGGAILAACQWGIQKSSRRSPFKKVSRLSVP